MHAVLRTAVLLSLAAAAPPGPAYAAGAAALEHVSVPRTPAICSADGLCLEVTVGPANPADLGACATTTSVTATVGDPISWCYTLTNQSNQTLAWHSLSDSLHGTVFAQQAATLGPGQSLRHVLVERAAAAAAGPLQASWSASAEQARYDVDDTQPMSYVDASGEPALAMTGGFASGRSQAVQLPFAFDFFGVTTDRLCVGQNGAIEVGSTVCAVPGSMLFPSPYLNAVIAPVWMSFDPSRGSLHTRTLGEPGQRRFVIEWKDLALTFPVMEGYTFEVVIEEATGAVVFQYLSTGSGDGAWGNAGDGAVSGLQQSPSSGQMYSQFAPTLTPGKAVRWTPAVQPRHSVATTADYDIGAPRLLLPIPAMTAFAGTGITIQQPLVIGNIGNRTLDWTAGEYPAAGSPLRHLKPLPAAADGHADAGRATVQRTLPLPSRPAQTLGEWQLPAYAMHLITGTGVAFVDFDLRNPANRRTIMTDTGTGPGLDNISGGDFVGDDFAVQYQLDTLMDRLYRVDTLTGARTLIGWPTAANTVANERWSGAAWDPATDTFYAVTTANLGNQGCYWSGLYTIDLGTAQAHFVGPVDTGGNECLIDIAFDQSGALYALDIRTDALFTIDKATAQATRVGGLGVDANFAQSIKFDRASGTLYWLGYAQGVGFVATLDPVTAQPAVVGPTPDSQEMSVLAIATAGTDCSTPQDVPWLSLQTSGGSFAPGAPVGVYPVTFDATQLAAGEYHATICVFSNDPAYRAKPAAIPVTFTVQAPDAIFADAFESP